MTASIREKVAVSIAIQGIVAAVFLAIEASRGPHVVEVPKWIHTSIDDVIPFVPYSVWLYVSWYLTPVLLLCLSRQPFRLASAAILASFLLCSLIYVMLPIEITRPRLDDVSLATSLLGVIYALDRPRNVFPSFHAAVCAVVLHVVPASGVMRVGLIAWMLGICSACVLTKQHYVNDVLAGIVVGHFATGLVSRGGVVTWQEERKIGQHSGGPRHIAEGGKTNE